MTTDPVKLQILKRVQTNLEPLTTEEGLDGKRLARVVSRKASLMVMEPKSPAVHYVAGPEKKIDEDTVCYTMQFSLWVKLFFPPGRDPGAATDKFEGAVQEKIELDDQLGGLADWVKYESNDPYLFEEGGTDGGTIMHYTVQYRRAKAAPDRIYAGPVVG